MVSFWGPRGSKMGGGDSSSSSASALPAAWKKLQNGSDIRGVALATIESEPVTLTAHNVALIGAAFALWLGEAACTETMCKPLEMVSVAIGHDSRISAEFMKTAVAKGLAHVKVQAFDAGLASTPAMFMSTILKDHEYDGAIMLTASHLPSNRNGLKFFTSKGGLESAEITEILARAHDLEATVSAEAIEQVQPVLQPIGLMDAYSAHLVSLVRKGTKSQQDKPLQGFHIIVDAGNGAGGFFVDKVLIPLGANTAGSQFLDPDGTFPNHIPNPEDHAAMKACSEATLKHKADLGICFDTDVDRAAVVDSAGTEINRDRLIALLAKIVLAEHPNSTIVTDSVTSNGLAAFIAQLGGVHHRFKRGYKNVINEGVRLNAIGQETHLAIETSGHGAVKENYFLDDGAYLVVKILVQLANLGTGSTLGSLIRDLREPIEDEEFRFKIAAADFKAVGTKAIEKLREGAVSVPGWSLVPNNFEGVRVACDAQSGDGWLLLRLSLHDPVLPLNIQSDSRGGVKIIAQKLLALLDGIADMDVSPVTKYVTSH